MSQMAGRALETLGLNVVRLNHSKPAEDFLGFWNCKVEGAGDQKSCLPDFTPCLKEHKTVCRRWGGNGWQLYCPGISSKARSNGAVHNEMKYDNKKTSTAKRGKQSTGENEDHKDAEDTGNDKQVPWLSSWWRKQVPLEKNTLAKWMRKSRIPTDHQHKKLELQFTSALAYLQTCMIPKNHPTSVISTIANVNFLCSVLLKIATLSKLRLLLFKSCILKLTCLVKEDVRQGIWGTFFTRKRADLVHRRYTLLGEFTGTFELSTSVFNALGRPVSFSVDQLQTAFDLLTSMFPGKNWRKRRTENCGVRLETTACRVYTKKTKAQGENDILPERRYCWTTWRTFGGVYGKRDAERRWTYRSDGSGRYWNWTVRKKRL